MVVVDTGRISTERELGNVSTFVKHPPPNAALLDGPGKKKRKGEKEKSKPRLERTTSAYQFCVSFACVGFFLGCRGGKRRGEKGKEGEKEMDIEKKKKKKKEKWLPNNDPPVKTRPSLTPFLALGGRGEKGEGEEQGRPRCDFFDPPDAHHYHSSLQWGRGGKEKRGGGGKGPSNVLRSVAAFQFFSHRVISSSYLCFTGRGKKGGGEKKEKELESRIRCGGRAREPSSSIGSSRSFTIQLSAGQRGGGGEGGREEENCPGRAEFLTDWVGAVMTVRCVAL